MCSTFATGDHKQVQEGGDMVRREAQLREEISDRLTWALERQGPEPRSIRWLEGEMQEREADITSYGAVRSYVKGEKLPPLTFLEEAAEALSVRREWLILGEGEMTPSEENLREQGIEELCARHPQLTKWPDPALEVFVELLGAYALQAPEGEEMLADEDDGLKTNLEEDLICLTTLPLRCWGFRGLEDLSRRERYSFLLNMLSAALVAVESRAQGDPLSDRAASLLPALRRATEELRS